MPLPSPAGIGDADRLGRGLLPAGDHAGYADPKFLAPECPRRGSGTVGPRLEWEAPVVMNRPLLEILLRCLSFSAIRKSAISRISFWSGRKARSSSGLRFPPPQQPKASPMPANQSIRFDGRESLSSRKALESMARGQLRSSLRPARFDLALQIQSQLFAEKQVLGSQCSTRLEDTSSEPQDIQQKVGSSLEHIGKGIDFWHQRQGRIPEALSSLRV